MRRSRPRCDCGRRASGQRRRAGSVVVNSLPRRRGRRRTLAEDAPLLPSTDGRPLRVAWTLEEIGVGYEPVALSADECRADAHLQRHPLGRVPALELDDGRVLFESTAIVLAIADRYPEAGLTGPLGSALRDQVYAWSIMAMTELERTTLGAWKRTEHVEDAYRLRQLDAFTSAALAVGAQLADRPFLLGDTLTAADIVLGGVLAVSRFAGVLDAVPAHVVAYLDHR